MLRLATVLFGLLCGVLPTPRSAVAQPTPAATAAYDSYVAGVEARLAQQHRSSNEFLAPADQAPGAMVRLRQGDILVDPVADSGGAEEPGAMLHHWRGTAFLPGVSANAFERFLRDVDAYPQRFAPEVLEARVTAQRRADEQIWMRVRQKHVIPVVMEETFDMDFGRMDAQHGYSLSRSRRIVEMSETNGTDFKPYPEGQDHGFLWRLNTYWSYAEGDGGLYVQVESVSLSRAIPQGLAWVLRPYVKSVPRSSLEFTLLSARQAFAGQAVASQKEETR